MYVCSTYHTVCKIRMYGHTYVWYIQCDVRVCGTSYVRTSVCMVCMVKCTYVHTVCMHNLYGTYTYVRTYIRMHLCTGAVCASVRTYICAHSVHLSCMIVLAVPYMYLFFMHFNFMSVMCVKFFADLSLIYTFLFWLSRCVSP